MYKKHALLFEAFDNNKIGEPAERRVPLQKRYGNYFLLCKFIFIRGVGAFKVFP
jgi:hypothetical protein